MHALKTILKNGSGFIYYVSIAGVTGTQSAQASDVNDAIKRIRKQTDLPIAVGFGIKTAQDVKKNRRTRRCGGGWVLRLLILFSNLLKRMIAALKLQKRWGHL